MLQLREVNIDDKQTFDKYITKHNPQISELNFTNIFMWRNSYKFRFGEVGEMLCLISVPDNDEPFAFEPIGAYTKEAFIQAIDEISNYFKEKNWKLVFKRVEEDKLDYFKEYFKNGIDITDDRNNSDYLYLSEDLINLKGKKYHKKKNHLNSFTKNYEFEYVKLTDDLIDECIRINEEWCKKRSCEQHRNLYCERLANLEALTNFKKLKYEGALIKVNGKYEAFTVGELLNSDTAVIHIEKANDDIRGLYNAINQQFCENTWKNTVYINREQDLGIEGLRKAKLSYNPVKLVNKYTITCK
ncbi:DUF2156 domain-containing protein [Acetivibrio clariflavus]|uniref:Phosphatidylglycerol lysyltransferase C-terminal domain-containing protein n=1 Tax=Acetivibrio clariflavus (strain DSM 19732 / NBRC 101661 / EBR45) TaxID=720554 RepID=G8LY92_ACECE|nr:phosphatidylglycerol lysyltransferase domain-containing protein [Acetivibrio clariflavus]AEV67823.1 hypothetical protein Clocl_1151 [Acetivibrio clariflavus DSM 19732]HOQ01655.1 phosphatidylglycerol lysyltransferase domain-containing protein [Acetivibrio clariflavus]HPU42409.1 phosphatidylglycerol lysyltransferase domain-containing protein [Acetivibrio clariflavus]